MDKSKKIGILSVLAVTILVFGGFAFANSISDSEEQAQDAPKQVQLRDGSCQQGSCGGNCDGSCGGNCGVKSCGCGR